MDRPTNLSVFCMPNNLHLNGNIFTPLLSVHALGMYAWVSCRFFWFPVTVQKQAARQIGNPKLPLDVDECEKLCVHVALLWPGVPGEFSVLLPVLPG